MPRATCAIDDYSLTEFQELLADLRFTSLKTANLSTNVALAFLTGIPHISRNADTQNLPSITQDLTIQRLSTPRDNCMLDHDHFIELEDDRHERQIAADEAELEKSVTGPRYAPESEASDVPSKLRSKLRHWRTRISTVWHRYRTLNSSKMNNSNRLNGDLEETEVKLRKKFYISYAELIIPSQDTYNPDFLHVPLHYGLVKWRMAARTAASHSMPIIYDEDVGDHYVPPKDGRQTTTHHEVLPPQWDVNGRFRVTNEWLHPTLSLTKLSRIKLMLFLAPRSVPYLDPSTVFSAWILFERLVIKGSVTKFNRKLYAATCLILSYKFNQDGEQVVINEILAYLSRDRSISPRAIFAAEMKVFTLLEFSLKQSYSGMRKHVNHYLEFNRISFMDLYETSESTYINLENEGQH